MAIVFIMYEEIARGMVCFFHQKKHSYLIFKIFSLKISAKKLAFFTQNKAKLYKILIITLVFEKKANFFAENCQKSQKIVIITSTPGRTACSERNRVFESRLYVPWQVVRITKNLFDDQNRPNFI
jgi:hypothetical protein